LQGLYSLRASRGRYQIIYKVEDDTLRVLIVRIGIRKGKDRGDVYKALKRELRRKRGLS
jgi:mRNA-degrading endonuclease RelE of RelBE toxin-antitoxin system